MGIGGAIMNVPVLKFFGFSINRAIGSAAAVGFLIATTASIGFLITGNYKEIICTFKHWFYKYSSFFNICSYYNIYGKAWSKNCS